MSDTQGQTAVSQAVSLLQHEKLTLQKRLSETQLENQVLRMQLYHVSSLLDVAVSRLGQMGVSLETPLDIRSLRNSAMQLQAAKAAGQGAFGPDDLANPDEESQNPQNNKKFCTRVQLREHTKAVHCSAFRPGEEPFVATGGLDRRILIQSFFSGEKVWDVVAHDENISCLSWFEGSVRLLSGSFDNTVKIWDTSRTEGTPVFQHTSSGFVLSAVPLDKGFVFACADSRRRTSIIDTRTHKPIHWDHESRVNTMTFDSSMGNVVMGHANGFISLWDIRKIGVALSSTTGTGAGSSAGNSNASSLPRTTAAASSADAVAPLLRAEPSAASPPPGGNVLVPPASLPASCVSQFANETSHAPISSITHFLCRDDTKRLICVSGDNMVRMYRGALSSTSTSRTGEYYHLRNAVSGIPTRGFTLTSGFWRGKKDKAQVPMFYDDVEKDAEQPAPRRLVECDLLVTGGPDNTATVFDVSEEGPGVIVEHLEGHRDRVTSVTAHHSDSRPIIATTSLDSTVRIWVPVKT